MKTDGRLSFMPLALSLASFLVISYVLCVLYGLLLSGRGFHQAFAQLVPGFTWLTWPSFLLGLLWSGALGLYVAGLFVPLFNFFARRT